MAPQEYPRFLGKNAPEEKRSSLNTVPDYQAAPVRQQTVYVTLKTERTQKETKGADLLGCA